MKITRTWLINYIFYLQMSKKCQSRNTNAFCRFEWLKPTLLFCKHLSPTLNVTKSTRSNKSDKPTLWLCCTKFNGHLLAILLNHIMSNLTESGDGQGAAVLTQDVVKSSTATSLGGRSSTNSSCGSSTRGKRRRSKQNNLLTVADVYDIAADIGMEI